MSNDRLADIKARTDAATSGPWTVMWPGQCCDGYCIEEASVHGAEHSMSDAEVIARRLSQGVLDFGDEAS